MIDIVVRETAPAGNGTFAARVEFENRGGEDVSVSVPVDDAGEKLLAWYFEEHLRFPFLDGDLERKAVELVAEYGRSLFRQVFVGEAAYGYRDARRVGFDDYRLVVRGSAAFQRLHWEALRDPDSGDRLALRMPVVRQDARTPLPYDLPAPAPTVNILVVTARPFGRRDVGYRTISQPLLDAIGQTDVPVTVDLVRPGTWEALRETLRAAERERGQGWYQVVHFDVHGGFGIPGTMTTDTGGSTTRYLFDPAHTPAANVKQGFLFFETGTAGEAQAVPSAQVARLLAEHRVAVAVLNACQSAMQTGDEASLAHDLVTVGAPVAVGMAYSVTVSAAKRAMPVFYERLAAGDDPVRAAFEARRALHDVKARQAYFEYELDLEDWILPVVYAQRESRLKVRPMTPTEEEVFYRRREQVAVAPVVEYGFVGRDLDLHAMERMLLTDPQQTQVLVRGMAGAGKSTLLAQAGWWWQRTGLVDQVFTFSYEHRAWTAEQMIRHIAHELFTPVEFAQWDALGDAAKAGRITTMLRASRHLIVVDNAESITASPAAIPHALLEADRDRLARWLASLKGGKTLLLVGSREAETWLAGYTFTDRVYELRGLDPQAASVMLDRILTRHGGTRWLSDDVDKAQRQALQELMRVLDGYPLSMTVVLPNLATARPTEVLAELHSGDAGVDPTMAARRAIEYSHGKLDPALQRSLLLLAPFTATIPAHMLDDYFDALRAALGSEALDGVDLVAAVSELRRVGLAADHPMLRGFVQTVPVLPFFLRNRMRDQPDLVRAVDQAHYELYLRLGAALQQMLLSHDPQERLAGQAGATAEYANFTAALGHAQRTAQPVMPLVGPLEEFLDQTQQHNARRQLLDDAIARHPATDNPDQQDELATLHNLAGVTALAQRRLDDAYRHHQAELTIGQAIGARFGQGATYGQLGRVAQEQRRFEQAERHYHQALEIFQEFGDRHSAARTYHNLGVIAQSQKRLDQAERHYRQALDIKRDTGDRHSAASTYHQLGVVAQEQRQFDQAEQHYVQALDIYLEFGDRHSAARTYHNIGVIAQAQKQLERAEQHYRQALDIYLEFGDRHSAAGTYHQLGRVAQEEKRFEQALQHYRQALDIYLEFGDRHSAAGTYHQLGRVAQEQTRYDDAEEHYQQALDIRVEFGDRHSAASTHHQLGVVAQLQKRFDQALQHYQQALDTYLEFGDRHSAAGTYHQLGRVAQEQTRCDDAEEHYQQALDIFLQFEDRHSTAITYRHLAEIYIALGRDSDAVGALLQSAASWQASTETWPTQVLDLLRREKGSLPPDEFEHAVSEIIPADLRESLRSALGPDGQPAG
ncbi:tetratricopeptide repeat protein [Actinoplanes sp. NPDC049548]|uniref:tetratricopeptide repeat protein n=1 Tax=Actinoplanes sp. NPDC049548 TaxID=3155152 RepID=UPI00342EE89B